MLFSLVNWERYRRVRQGLENGSIGRVSLVSREQFKTIDRAYQGTVNLALDDAVISTQRSGQVTMGIDTGGRAAICIPMKVLPKWKNIRSVARRDELDDQDIA